MHPPIIEKTDFNSLLNTLRRKYPHSGKTFTAQEDDENIQKRLSAFLRSFDLELICKQTVVIKERISGTYSYKIIISQATAKRLDRKNCAFNYYGIKSKKAAFEKGIEKSFQIIQCLLTDRTLSEQVRYR